MLKTSKEFEALESVSSLVGDMIIKAQRTAINDYRWYLRYHRKASDIDAVTRTRQDWTRQQQAKQILAALAMLAIDLQCFEQVKTPYQLKELDKYK
jgi:hypothetical protein